MDSYEKRDNALCDGQELRGIEITTGRNGYPRCVHAGIIGFENFAQAEASARAYNGRVVLFRRREGWQLYEAQYGVSAPIQQDDRLKEVDGIFLYYPGRYKDEEEFVFEEVRPDLEGLDSSEEKDAHIKRWREIYEKLEQCDDKHFVCDRFGELEILPCETMTYREDVWEFEVGVEFWSD